MVSATLSFAGAQVTLSPSTTPASEKDAGFIITGVRHFPDGHIEAEVRNFSGKIIITAEEPSASVASTTDEEAVGERQSFTDINAELDVTQSRKVPEKYSPKLTDKTADRLGSGWGGEFFDYLEELWAYKKEHGHTNVRKRENKCLASFVSMIRQEWKNPEQKRLVLNDARIKLLDGLGFSWEGNNDPSEDFARLFSKRLGQLRAFKEEHGHLAVKKHNQVLANFCTKVRKARRSSKEGDYFKLTEEHIASLNALGFDWSGRPTRSKCQYKSFAERFEELKEYQQTHGHLNVDRKTNQTLHTFCAQIRTARWNPDKRYQLKLTQDLISSLDSIGFPWGKPYKSFDERIEDLKRHYAETGSFSVTRKQSSSLYAFVTNLRSARRTHGAVNGCKLTEDRIATLDAIGFSWF